MIERRLLHAAPVLLLAGVALACGAPTTPQIPSAAQDNGIGLMVRVHLLQSDEVEALNAALTESDVATLFAGANRIWDPADITWHIESVIREPAQNPGDYERLLVGEIPDPLPVLLSIFPRENLLPGGWDVFVLRDLGRIAGGVYVSFPEAQIAFFAEFGPAGRQEPTGLGPRVLAHELGHSLGLPHVPGSVEGNLMAPGLRQPDRVRLTPAQIQASRGQALKGTPFVGNASVANRDQSC